MLAASIAVQSFEPVAWRDAQILESPGGIDSEQLGPCPALNLVGDIPNQVTGE